MVLWQEDVKWADDIQTKKDNSSLLEAAPAIQCSFPPASVSGLCWSKKWASPACDWFGSRVLHQIFFLLSSTWQAFCRCFSDRSIYHSWRAMLFPKEAFLCHRGEKCVSSRHEDMEGHWCPRNKCINGLSNVLSFSTLKYYQGKEVEKDLQIENCSVWG